MTDQPHPMPPPAKRSKLDAAKLPVVVILAAVLIIVGFIGAGNDPPAQPATPTTPSAAPTFTPDHYEAEAACQEFVSRHLKAPSTADFGDWSSSNEGTSWTVTGRVDSQNSFGAQLRSQFTCQMGWSGSAKQWTLASLTGLN